ncbi:hypothetical protein MA16_Dca002216 [Dendrobium catenatum]|uniref:Uncharacterized protein n=1 Tax=Dendrobium catenatum TaxID=906689 RepID=A0A2I0VZX4_9ASPA|nr:hypothetical protein MA16_Dca002216 [Dendrobium catenatum]
MLMYCWINCKRLVLFGAPSLRFAWGIWGLDDDDAPQCVCLGGSLGNQGRFLYSECSLLASGAGDFSLFLAGFCSDWLSGVSQLRISGVRFGLRWHFLL